MAFLALTALLSAASLYLAAALYAPRPRTPSRVFLSAAFVLVAFWLVVSFSHLWFAEPGPGFITYQYRMCFFLVIMAAGSLFLFALAHLKDERLGNRLAAPVFLSALACALLCLTPLVVRRAEFSANAFSVECGPLVPLLGLSFAFFTVGMLYLLHRKMARSAGVERARTAYLVLGFGIFFLATVVFNGIFPVVLGKDTMSDFSYPFVCFPVCLTAYALLRHRLLDVRLAFRKAFSYLLTLFLFGVPYLMLYLLLSHYLREHAQALAALSLAALASSVALAPLALRLTSRWAARIFYPGLYDDKELLQAALTLARSREDLREGLMEALALVAGRLELNRACLLVAPGIHRGGGAVSLCCRRDGEVLRTFQEKESERAFHLPPPRVLLAEELVPGGEHEGARREMRRMGAVAAFPLRGIDGPYGALLVGEKANGGSLDPLDVDFLESLARELGPLVESHLQSLELQLRLEDLERVVRELEESDRIKTDIISVTSQEFRSPVTILYGFAAALRERLGYQLPEEIRESLEYIESSAERIRRLLDKFLVVSHLRRGEERPALAPCLASEVLEEACSFLGERERERLVVEGEPEGCGLVTDRRYLSLILANLLENAYLYSDDSSPVILRVRDNGEEVLLEVEDFGEGFEKEEVERVFAPFTRLENAVGRGEGAGLGLYIVRLCADLLGLEVKVDSRPGEGSRFALHGVRRNGVRP